ncbi:MAG: hypothetical protein AAF942_08750 [Pseudomonadota bacterium]
MMDVNLLALLVIMLLMIGACVAVFLRFLGLLRHAGSESRRRLVARSAVVTWAGLALLTPAIMLAALDVLPRWIGGAALVFAFLVSLYAARHVRRTGLHTRSAA